MESYSYIFDDILEGSNRDWFANESFFRCDAPVVYEYALTDWIPAYSHVISQEKIELSFTVDDTISTMTTLENKWSFSSRPDKVRSFVHDFTFGMWMKETDSRLDSHFPHTCRPGDACLTPDYIKEINGVYYVVEFTTRNTTDPAVLSAAFRDKQQKYSDALNHIAREERKQIVYYIVAVSCMAVYTNLTLTQPTATELGYRFKISNNIYSELRLRDLYLAESIIFDDLTQDLHNWLKTITLEGMDRSGEYSEEALRELKREYDHRRDGANFNNTVWKIYGKSFKAAELDAKDFQKGTEHSLLNESTKWEAFRSDFTLKNMRVDSLGESGLFSRNYQKTVANVPFVALRTTSQIPEWKGICNDRTQPLSYAWNKALSRWFNSQGDSEESFWLEEQDSEEVLNQEIRSIILGVNERDADMELMKDHKVKMRSRNRIILDLEEEILLEFAKVGVEGKSMLWNTEVRSYRSERKKSLHIDTPIDDLELFFEEYEFTELLDCDEAIWDEHFSPIQIRNLLTRADQIQIDGQSNIVQYHKEMRQYICSRLFSWSKMVSDIATELAISFKHHCNKNEFIIKKLKESNLWLLIKPTRSGSHVFFSLAWKKEDMLPITEVSGKIFRECETDGTWCWTDWVSLNNAKLTNWALTESRSITLFQYWCEFMGLPPHPLVAREEDAPLREEAESVREYEELLKEAVRMTMLCLLIGLSDKAEVEEVITSSRFMIMEGFKAYPSWPRPYKMYEKFPTHLKSRLTLWVLRKLRNLSISICGRPYKIEFDEEIPDSGNTMTVEPNSYLWRGFKNPFTGHLLKDAGQLINLMYLGYIKNKNESGEANTAGKLTEKIISLEREFTEEVKSRIGRTDKLFNSDTSHEWNITLLRTSSEICRKEMDRYTANKDIKETLGRDWVRRLAHVSIEDTFCTLKASSNYDKEWFVYRNSLDEQKKKKEVFKDMKKRREAARVKGDPKDDPADDKWENPKHHYTRSKLIEKCLKMSPDSDLKMLTILRNSFKTLTNNNYLRICIFKKQQHGGLREIFVLGYEERIVQYAIELAGRVLCERFMGETMTHPISKKTLVNEHHRKVKSTFRRGFVQTSYTSADSRKWSQNQYCSKLLQMFLLFFPSQYHNFFIRALELWRHKKIKISDDLLHLIEHKPETKFWDPISGELSSAYHGLINIPWMKKGSSHLDVTTGMMQGILHYSSSAFHSVVNRSIELCCTEIVSKKKFPNIKILTTTMQSSDDSGFIITINDLVNDLETRKQSMFLLLVLHYFKAFYSEEVAIKDSVKTTFHCPYVFEFNSKFHIGNQLYEPEIKIAYASNLITHCENMVSKQEESYTLTSSYISTGGSCYMAKWIQYSQGFFHYRTLGAQVSPYWMHLYYMLQTISDPSIGFYLTDHPVCAGIPGFNFLYWKAVLKTRLNKVFKVHLERLLEVKTEEAKKAEKEDIVSLLGYSTVGGVTRNHSLGFGSLAKIKRMKRDMELPEDWMAQLDENPDLFFRNASSKPELKLKVCLKLSQRGVASSLSGTPAISQSLASSIYIIQERVMNLVCSEIVTEEFKEMFCTNPERKVESVKKFSLMELYLSMINITTASQLSLNEMTTLFPLHTEYAILNRQLAELEDFCYTRKDWNKQRVSTEVKVYEGESFSAVNVYSILAEIWFPGMKSRCESKYGRNQCELVFRSLQDSYPWLKRNPKESLKSSPFLNFAALYNWFKTLETRTRKISIVGAPIISRRGQTTLLSYIKNNAARYHKLSFGRDSIVDINLPAKRYDYYNCILNCLSFPFRHRLEALSAILKRFHQQFSFSDIRTRSRLNNMVVLSKILSNSDYRIGRNGFHDLRMQADSLEQITSNKEGCIGTWSVRQKWNEKHGKYMGYGIWLGSINGLKTKIVVDTPSVVNNGEVYVYHLTVQESLNPDDYKYWIKGLILWSRESHVLLEEAPSVIFKGFRKDSLRLYGRVLDQQTVGIPVVKVRASDLGPLDWETDSSFYIDIPTQEELSTRENVQIRLKCKGPSSTHESTILSISFSSKDWTCDPSSTRFELGTRFRDNGIVESFIYNKPLSVHLASSAVSSMINYTSTDLELKKLIVGILQGTFKSQSLVPRALITEQPMLDSRVVQAEIDEDEPYIEDDDFATTVAEYEFSETGVTIDPTKSDEPSSSINFELMSLVSIGPINPEDPLDDEDTIFQNDEMFTVYGGMAYVDLMQPVIMKRRSILDTITRSHLWLTALVDQIKQTYNMEKVKEILGTKSYPPNMASIIPMLNLVSPGNYRMVSPPPLSNIFFGDDWV